MTENEAKAIKWMKNVRDDAVVTLDHIEKNEPNVSPMLYKGRKEKAEIIIKGFEELEQYRSIGTVEEIRKVVQFLSLDNGNGIIEDMKELNKYKAIGTVSECREAVEKQRAKKPIRMDMCTCPKCGTYNGIIKKRRNTVNQDFIYCWHCGQAMEVNREDTH